jgi:hypothetical protein
MKATKETHGHVNADDAQHPGAANIGRPTDDHHELVSAAVQRLLLRRDRSARQKFSAFGSAG